MANKNNDVLYDAAVAGITAGILNGTDYSQISATSLATPAGVAQQAQIAAAALAVDSAVPNDATLSTNAGVLYVVPFAGSGAAAAVTPFFTKPALLAVICKSAFAGRSLAVQAGTTTPYATVAAGIAAQYAAALTQLVVA